MTPPAATAAGRALPRTVAPRTARRVSGPARPKRDPHRQPKSRAGAAPRRATTTAEPLGVRALRRGQAMADSRFLARLIGGRLWIPVVAVGLIGIVFMQVTMLSMNSSISRTVESASALERTNAKLRADVSTMESGERIDRAAAGLGMVVPQDTDYYVSAGGAAQAAAAAARMTNPDPDAVARTQATTAAATATASTTSTAAPTTAAAVAPSTTAAAPTASTTAAGSTTPAQAPTSTTAPTQQVAAPAATASPAPAPQATVAPAAAAAPTQQQASSTAAAGGTVAPGA